MPEEYCFECKEKAKPLASGGLKKIEWSWETIHPQLHSLQLGTCVDVDIAHSLEWINENIGLTISSCQGGGKFMSYLMMSSEDDYYNLMYFMRNTDIHFVNDLYHGFSFPRGFPKL